jgi:Na+-translocating ferredoxin:NAD+ oxidoreductase RnfG subunit
MSIWAICSRLAAGAALLLGAAPPLRAQLSLQEALQAAFPPPAVVERRTAFLSPAALDSARADAGSDAPVNQSVVTYYVAARDRAPLGVAYFDSHRVRTLNEVLMIVVGPDDKVQRIEVLRFAEPPEYHPRDGWLAQFQGHTLGPDLSLKGSISAMTGATLTSNAVTRSVRRVLALHRRIHPFTSTASTGP